MNCIRCGQPISGIMADMARESGTQLCGGRYCKTEQTNGRNQAMLVEQIYRLNTNLERLMEKWERNEK